VGIAGIAIFAPEFAPPVGIDGPLERHVGPGAVENAARGQLEIPHFALFLEQFAPGSQSRDAYELHGCYFRFLFAFWQEQFRVAGYNMPMPENTLPENLDAVLRKYGKIWIWSILSAAVAALSVRLVSSAGILTFQGSASPIPGNRNSPWSPLLMLVTFLPSLGTVASVWFLLQFLRHHILPILFPPPTPAT